MNSEVEKHFSVVIRLNEFEGLNGELSRIADEHERKTYVREYFLRNYGEGVGTLEILQKQSKVKLLWRPPSVDQKAEDLHQVALMHAKNRNFVEAINTWVKAISVNANDPDYYFNLGIAFFEIKNYKESIENLKKVLSLCPIYYKAHIILGTVYLKVRQFKDSEHHLKESVKFHPKHALAYLNLGAVYSIARNYDHAIQMFNKVLELTPQEVRAHFGIGKIYSLKKDFEKAKFHFTKVLQLDKSGRLVNYARKAMVDTSLGTEEEASGSEENLKIDSSNVDSLYQEGYKAFLYSDYKKAILYYNKYLQTQPTDDFLWFSLGEAYLRSGEPAKAVNALLKAVKENSSKSLYFKELAVAYSCLGKDSEVIRCLNKAKQLGKSDSTTSALWGKALCALEKYDEAIPILTHAVKLNDNNLFAKFNLALAYHGNKQTRFALNYLHEIARAPINSPLKMEAEALTKELEEGGSR